MNKLYQFILVLFLSFISPLVFSQDLSRTLYGTNTATVLITVGDDGYPQVHVDSVTVGELHRIVWVGPVEFTIEFPNDSPFEENRYTSKNGVLNLEMPDRDDDEFLEVFKYDVIVNGIRLDPMIIFKRPYA